MSSQTVSTKLTRIAQQSEQKPEMVFTTLAHLMDVEFLEEAFKKLRKKAAAGIDEVTVEKYRENLEENLRELHERLKSGRYRAQPARRQWIPKGDGKERPLAILVMEDKIVQKAVAMLLGAVYEPMFYDFSYGFRPERSQHQALTYLRDQFLALNINWVVDADILGFFDNIDRALLREILQRRVNDGGIMRLIGKWFNAGVLNDGELEYTDKGAQQGGVISPILSNIFLHTVLDDWFEREVRPRMKGRCTIVRFADDFVLGFELKSDAERVFEVLPQRLGKFGLDLHSTKSRLLQFSRPGKKHGRGKNTFDFLGFTHYWGRTRKGGHTIVRKTQRGKLRKAMTEFYAWSKANRHKLIEEQHEAICAKLRGHYNYYGIRGNYKMLEVFFEHVEDTWKKWLGRRTRNGYIKWEKFEKKIRKLFPLPKPRIKHAF